MRPYPAAHHGWNPLAVFTHLLIGGFSPSHPFRITKRQMNIHEPSNEGDSPPSISMFPRFDAIGYSAAAAPRGSVTRHRFLNACFDLCILSERFTGTESYYKVCATTEEQRDPSQPHTSQTLTSNKHPTNRRKEPYQPANNNKTNIFI